MTGMWLSVCKRCFLLYLISPITGRICCRGETSMWYWLGHWEFSTNRVIVVHHRKHGEIIHSRLHNWQWNLFIKFWLLTKLGLQIKKQNTQLTFSKTGLNPQQTILITHFSKTLPEFVVSLYWLHVCHTMRRACWSLPSINCHHKFC